MMASESSAAWRKTAAVAVAAGLLTVGCGTGGTTPGSGTSPGIAASSPAPSPTAALCADAAALRTSLHSLTHLSVDKRSANEIKSELAQVQANLAIFDAQAKGEWQAQASALKSALATLKTAASDLAAHPSASTVSGVLTAFGGVTSAVGSLLAAVSTRCPSASPSPST